MMASNMTVTIFFIEISEGSFIYDVAILRVQWFCFDSVNKVQCPSLNRITLGQHKSDNINLMIQLNNVFCVLFKNNRTSRIWLKWATDSIIHCPIKQRALYIITNQSTFSIFLNHIATVLKQVWNRSSLFMFFVCVCLFMVAYQSKLSFVQKIDLLPKAKWNK